MMVILIFINVLLLYAGIYWLLKKIAAGDSRAILLLTSTIVLFIAISIFYYLMLVFHQSFINLQLFLLAINLAHIFFTGKFLADEFKRRPAEPARPDSLWALSAVFFLTIYFVLYESKYGSWDAWAIWNLHAKILAHPELWHNLFSGNIVYSHPDYPLMLPATIAFFWKGINNLSPFVPVLFSYGILIMIPLALYFSLRNEGDKFYAGLALVIFVIDNNYKAIALSQCADSLLSLLILLTVVQYQNIKASSTNRIYALGFICASCAWVKNEGIAFFVLFTLGFLLMNFKNMQVLKKYFIGIAIPVLVVASFKISFAPANDLISAQNKHLLSLSAVLSDPGRYVTILKFAFNTLISSYMCAVIVIFAVLVFDRKFFLSLPFIIISALLGVYFITYLITPYDLNWHLSTSLNRLLQQVYPALIYLLFRQLSRVKWPAVQVNP